MEEHTIAYSKSHRKRAHIDALTRIDAKRTHSLQETDVHLNQRAITYLLKRNKTCK